VTRTRLRYSFLAIVVATPSAISQGQSGYRDESRDSRHEDPHAGDGVYTKVAIRSGATSGPYTGEFNRKKFLRRAKENRWQYMMGPRLRETAHRGHRTIDGIHGTFQRA